MGMCVLRVSGALFAVDEFLSKSDFAPSQVWHKGESRRHGFHKDSGFNLDVSEGSWEGLEEQIQGVIAFLNDNFPEIKWLMEYPGVEEGILDFAISKRDVAAQFDHFPPGLIRLAGTLGLGIDLSQYAVAEDDK